MIRPGRSRDAGEYFDAGRSIIHANPLVVIVMPGLVPGIHVYTLPSDSEDVDGRDIWREDTLRAFARP